MLMSVRRAANCDSASSSGSHMTCTPVSSAFVVKNTFIDVEGGDDIASEASRRRSNSAPASPRIEAASETVGNEAPLSNVDSIRFISTPTEKLGFRTQAWSTMSETSDVEGSEDLSTDAGTADAESQVDSHTDVSAHVFSDSGSDSEGPPLVPIALADLLHGHLEKTPPKVQLSSKARAWMPKSHGGQCCFPADIRIQFVKVLAAAQAAFGSCVFMESVQLIERAGGWTLAGVAQSALPQQVQLICAAVQQAIVHAAANSTNVYVLGYEKTPFVSAYGGGFGFSFRLALVQDESTACWNLLTGGYCSRGRACRHQHPAWHADVNVSLTTRLS